MPVYVDSVFAVNTLANALLLYSYCFFYGLKRHHGRLAAASAAGGLYAAAEAAFDLPHILRAGILIALILIVFGRNGVVKHTARLMLLCFAAEGITLAAISMLGASAELASGGMILFANEPVCAVLFISAYPIFCLCSRLIALRRKYIRLRVSYRGKEVKVNVLRDSGNLLRYHGKPVIMVAWDAVSSLFDYTSYKELKEKADAYAIYRTISGAGTVPVIEDAGCRADGAVSDAVIGIVERKFKDRYSGVAGDLY